MLANETCRCLGLLPAPEQTTQRCGKRDTCQRYTERAEGGERTPTAQWLCPGADDFYESYLEVVT